MDHSFKTHVLPNGLKIFFVPMKGIDHVFVQIYVGCGSQSEKKETLEIAHFVEHMQSFYTSKKHPKSKDIVKWMEDTGCRKNAMTNDAYTLYYITCLKKYFYELFEMQLESFTDFVLDKTIFNAERNSVLEEIQTNWLNYTWIDLFEKTRQTLFDVPWLQSKASERVELMKKFTPKDVLRFRDLYYHPSKMMIAVAGDFDCDRTKKMIGKAFTTTSVNKVMGDVDYTHVFTSTFTGPQIIYVPNKKVDNTRIEFTWLFPLTPSDMCTGEVLGFIQCLLTVGMDSRLMRILRTQKEMVYFVDLSYYSDYNGTSYVRIVTETNPKNIKSVMEIILSEVQKVKTRPITKTELERLKNKRLLETVEEPTYKGPSKYVDRYAEYFFYGKPVILAKERLKLIESITKKDMMRVASQVFQKEKLLVGYSGPKKHGGLRV